MTVDMSQFYQVFFEEAGEHLSNMENLLLSLDIESPEQEDLNAIFRAAHSIKGGSATFGFTDIAEVTHILESLLDRIRNGELALQKDMVDVFLRAGDILKDQLAAHQNNEESDTEAARGVCEELTRWQHSDESAAPASTAQPPENPPPADTDTAAEQRYTITFTPSSSPAEHGVHMENMAAELEKLGAVDILAEGSAENPVWRFALTTAAPEEAIREPFDFFAQPADVVIEPAPPAQAAAEEEQGYGFFTDIASPEPAEEEAEQGYGFFTDVDAVRKTAEEEAQGYGFFEKIEPPQETPPTAASGGGAGRRDVGQPKGDAASPGKRPSDKAATAAQTESIRVSVEKVDQLINLVGELVITQAMVAQTANKLPPDVYETLQVSLSQLEHNTRDLQESVMSIRMMPISFVFSRFPRVVRDLSSKLNKQVELKTVGEGTELDKGLIEKLSDPLTHLVRNSLDHGVESPEKRLAAGKPAKGTITLRASHQGGNVVIEVIDDGAGMDREKILAKAKERGIPVSDTIPDQEVWQLIFEAGFSTAEVVTDVSGRGVGMDVVKRNIIHGMGGRIEMESHSGAGTRIIIRLPLTLAILDGMSVSVGGDIFITPLTYIVESLKPREEDIKTVSGRGRVVYVRGEYVTLLPLHEVFNIQPVVAEPQDGILVLVEAEGKKVALFVDELVGQHQVVIKSLETNFRKVAGISGATIMGDGKVALILDISSLVRLSQG